MRSMFASVCLLAMVTLTTPAAAGYLSLGLGNGADLRGDFAARYETRDESDSGRIGVGQRFGPIAVEANLMGSDVGDDRTYSLGVDLKYFHDLGGGFDLYGKGGIGKTWLNAPTLIGDDDGDLSGRSKLLGVGLQFGFDAPIGQMAIWADYTRQYLDLRGDNDALSGELDLMQVGLSVGL